MKLLFLLFSVTFLGGCLNTNPCNTVFGETITKYGTYESQGKSLNCSICDLGNEKITTYFNETNEQVGPPCKEDNIGPSRKCEPPCITLNEK